MRYWSFGRLCTFALAVSNLAAPALGRPGLVLTGTGLRPTNEQDDVSNCRSFALVTTSGTLGLRFVGRMGLRSLITIRAWRARMRQRRELLMLNGVELRDLSLTEADVDRETRKPFWEGIQLTGR